jgi:hypothetical protein
MHGQVHLITTTKHLPRYTKYLLGKKKRNTHYLSDVKHQAQIALAASKAFH